MAGADPNGTTSGGPGRPLPPGARVLTLAEVRDGVRLATGREHVLVVPAPALVVEGPASIPMPPAGPTAIVSRTGASKSLSPESGPKTLWITHAGPQSTPTMPELANFRARVTGVSPDPTPDLTFEWTLTLDYATLARPDARLVSQVAYKITGRGGTLPADAFRRAPGAILKGHVATTPAAPGRPAVVDDRTAVAGGRLTIDVAVVVAGVGRLTGRLTGYAVLSWDNPSAAAMRAYLGTLTDPTEAAWVADVFCAETQMMQFSHRTAGAYRRAFHPLANGGGDGGVGLGQLSHPDATTPQQTWDWRANARAALAIYQGTRRPALNYVRTVQDALAAPSVDSPYPVVQALASYRQRANLPPLAAVRVADFTAQQLREDQARGYNGFVGSRKGAYPPQFGNRWHEFRLETEGTPPRVRISNERVEGGVRVADAAWVRVPDEERPPGPELAHYVEQHVLKPTCP